MNVDPHWLHAHKNKTWGKWPNENMVRFVSRQFGTAPDRAKVRFLDLGCGAGSSALFLAQEGFDVLAVDGSPDAIEAMMVEHRRRGISGKTLATMVADLTSFDIPIGFDCIIDICTLQHLSDSDARQVISRARQWLKPKGWFFSIMAAPGWVVPSSEKPRIVDAYWVGDIFRGAGFEVHLGKEETLRPDSTATAHWIVQAQRN